MPNILCDCQDACMVYSYAALISYSKLSCLSVNKMMSRHHGRINENFHTSVDTTHRTTGELSYIFHALNDMLEAHGQYMKLVNTEVLDMSTSGIVIVEAILTSISRDTANDINMLFGNFKNYKENYSYYLRSNRLSLVNDLDTVGNLINDYEGIVYALKNTSFDVAYTWAADVEKELQIALPNLKWTFKVFNQERIMIYNQLPNRIQQYLPKIYFAPPTNAAVRCTTILKTLKFQISNTLTLWNKAQNTTTFANLSTVGMHRYTGVTLDTLVEATGNSAAVTQVYEEALMSMKLNVKDNIPHVKKCLNEYELFVDNTLAWYNSLTYSEPHYAMILIKEEQDNMLQRDYYNLKQKMQQYSSNKITKRSLAQYMSSTAVADFAIHITDLNNRIQNLIISPMKTFMITQKQQLVKYYQTGLIRAAQQSIYFAEAKNKDLGLPGMTLNAQGLKIWQKPATSLRTQPVGIFLCVYIIKSKYNE